MPNSISIQKRSLNHENFQANKLKNFLAEKLNISIEPTNQDLLISKAEKQFFDNISTIQITDTLILTATSLIEKDPIFDKIATQLLLQKTYRKVFQKKVNSNNFRELYQQSFINSLKIMVEKKKKSANPKLLEFDLEKLSQELVLERDNLFNYIGLEVVYSRYFWSKDKQILETPQAFWMRIAMGLALNEENKNEKAIEFYHIMSTFRFVPSTPTLFHSGLKKASLSSCFLATVEDDLKHIFKSYWDTATLLKYSGGVATDWTNLRAVGSLIESVDVESTGVISFLKGAEATTSMINRSGRRRGATVVYLEAWHLEVEDFLDLRKNVGDERRRTHDLNLALWIPDLFMKRVRDKGKWTLFSPSDTPNLHHLYGKKFEEEYVLCEQLSKKGKIKLVKEVNAFELWKKVLTRLFETGYPWITFKDACNVRSPQDHVGIVHCSNLCTEITLNTSQEEIAVCNLGSVNLSKHIVDNKLDERLFKETILTAMRMLDNVIDINDYSILPKETKNSNLKHRPVGLGMMGFQDALFKLNIPCNSELALNFTNEITEKYSYHAISGSCQLAKERGTYSSYKGSKWDKGIFPLDTLNLLEQERGETIKIEKKKKMDWESLKEQVKKYGMRNSNTMAIAPTASISNIAGCYSCIEPMYSNLYTESNVSGEFVIVNKYLVEDLKKLGQWNQDVLDQIKHQGGSIQNIPNIPWSLKDKYKGVFELDPLWMIKIATERSKWIDQSISHNVFIAKPSGLELSKIYFTAWESGLKTTYYLRTLGASQVEKSTLDAGKFGYTQKRDSEQIRCLINRNKEDCESCQ